ncbi:MAG: hypothetical protein Q8K65_05140 [Alphaproteobacteria bacterium]|nr:hypothetical protein [Alphaproteobacteria bacterium]
MTTRHSVRDVKNTFEQILGDNAEALREIDKTISQTTSDIAGVDALYARALDKFITAQIRPMNSDVLKKLSDIAGTRDFEQEFNDGVTAARTAEIRLNGLVTTHGSESKLKYKLQALSDESNKLGSESLKLAGVMGRLQSALRPVGSFNTYAERIGKPKLEAGTIDYFSSKKGFSHVWAFIFDTHYRHGRALIRDFAAQGTTIPDTQKSLGENAANQAEKKARLGEMAAEAGRIEPVLKDIRDTTAKAVSTETLRERLKKDIVTAFDDVTFFNRAAKTLGSTFPVFVTEQRAKLENLRKILDGAQKSKQAVQQADGKLSKHMPKLRTAASRSGSTQMTIDLNGIKTSFGGMQKGVKAQAVQLRQTSAAVRDYKFGASSSPAAASAAPAGGMDPVFFMAVIMMSDINHSVTVPDVSVPGNIGDSFNGAALDAVSVPNIDIAVPDIAVSVPDISVPDVSISSGGFDGGGFSGGFDGGGF